MSRRKCQVRQVDYAVRPHARTTHAWASGRVRLLRGCLCEQSVRCGTADGGTLEVVAWTTRPLQVVRGGGTAMMACHQGDLCKCSQGLGLDAGLGASLQVVAARRMGGSCTRLQRAAQPVFRVDGKGDLCAVGSVSPSAACCEAHRRPHSTRIPICVQWADVPAGPRCRDIAA
jgi:hypothetical protein